MNFIPAGSPNNDLKDLIKDHLLSLLRQGGLPYLLHVIKLLKDEGMDVSKICTRIRELAEESSQNMLRELAGRCREHSTSEKSQSTHSQ